MKSNYLLGNEVHEIDVALFTNLATKMCRKLELYIAISQHTQHQKLACHEYLETECTNGAAARST